MIRFARFVALLPCLGLAVACAPKFMTTPSLYARARQPLFDDLDPEIASVILTVAGTLIVRL
jgi:hypothetical protein